MSKNTNNNTNDVAVLKARLAELEAEKAVLESRNTELVEKLEAKKANRAGVSIPTASETVRKARELTGIRKINFSKEQVHQLIGFNAETGRNEGVGRELGRYSIRNEKCGDDRASQDRYWTAKSFDTAGFYEIPGEGICYCAIYISKGGMRKVFAIDRMAKAQVITALEKMPKSERVVK